MPDRAVGTREEWLIASRELPPRRSIRAGGDELARRRRGFGYRVDEQNPGCTGCSFVADHFDGVLPHLNGHDVTLVAESIAPLPRLQAYAARMEWKFPWVSSLGSDFRYDFGAAFSEEQQKNGAVYNFRHENEVGSQREGMSAFILRDGVVHHTYSTSARGVEQLMGTFGYLDVSPSGRNEESSSTGAWWHRHDEYDAVGVLS